jgi:hypothetical protein
MNSKLTELVKGVKDEELKKYLEFRYLNKPREMDKLDRLTRDVKLRESLESRRNKKNQSWIWSKDSYRSNLGMC